MRMQCGHPAADINDKKEIYSRKMMHTAIIMMMVVEEVEKINY